MNNNVLNHIELQDIVLSYDGQTNVIENLSLSIKRGEFTTLLGPSGCGKTTLLRMIGGFESPKSGKILLDGKDIASLPPYLRPVNTVFQNYALFPHLNVYDNVAFGLKIKQMPKSEMTKKVQKALEIVDLEGFEKRSIDTLSGGQQQRIAIARAIVNEPEVLLLDEPLSALDYKMRKEMQLELKNIHKQLGITFVFVTHDQEEALTMSDKIVVMSQGIIQQIGTPEEIYNEPSTLFVADFIGDCNIFDGIMTAKKEVGVGSALLKCVDDYEVDTRVSVIIRPEDVDIVEAGSGQIDGVVTSADFKGTFYITFIEFEKYEIEVHTLKHFAPGTKVGLSIADDMIHLIPYDLSINHFSGTLGDITEEGLVPVTFGDITVNVDYRRIFAGEKMPQKETNGTHVSVYFSPDDAVMSDEEEAGLVQGNITSFYYVGDHYSYGIRSESDTEYVVNDPYLWNSGDMVSIKVDPDKLKITLVEGTK